jgi:alpha-glucosidase
VDSLRTWYTEKHLHFLDDGVDFWWNDEGETQWYTYHYWNLAQQQQWAKARPNERFFTINRAFTPGMQRFPATTWTGDRQDCSHEVMLRFSMYGQPFHECDMTSNTPTDLVRQYQNAVFSPIMRVHQMHGVPRFPYLWCDGARGGNHASGPEHCDAFRGALDLRYHFIPYVYSLAHSAHREGKPIARPALFEFPGWTHPAPADSDVWGTWHTYMFGSHIVTADLGFKDGAAKTENSSTVALPPGQWYKLNSTTTVKGDAVYTESNLAITDFPVYVREGAVLTLNQAKVQWSEAQGGALEVQVYGGADGSFTMYEDDGATLDYKTSAAAAAVRATNFTWTESSRTLSWTSSRGPVSATGAGAVKYTTLEVVLFEAGAGAVKRSPSQTIGNAGSVKMQ